MSKAERVKSFQNWFSKGKAIQRSMHVREIGYMCFVHDLLTLAENGCAIIFYIKHIIHSFCYKAARQSDAHRKRIVQTKKAKCSLSIF